MVTGHQGRHGVRDGLFNEYHRACDGDTQESLFSVIFNLGWLKFWGNLEPQNEPEDATSVVEGRAEREREAETWCRNWSP